MLPAQTPTRTPNSVHLMIAAAWVMSPRWPSGICMGRSCSAGDLIVRSLGLLHAPGRRWLLDQRPSVPGHRLLV
jgi:hypothetical protein